MLKSGCMELSIVIMYLNANRGMEFSELSCSVVSSFPFGSLSPANSADVCTVSSRSCRFHIAEDSTRNLAASRRPSYIWLWCPPWWLMKELRKEKEKKIVSEAKLARSYDESFSGGYRSLELSHILTGCRSTRFTCKLSQTAMSWIENLQY